VGRPVKAPRRKVAVVTGSRAEYGRLRLLLKRMLREPALELQLVVTGSHLSGGFGATLREIEADGLAIAARVKMLLPDNSDYGVARSIGRGFEGFASCFRRLKPDILLVLGDRFELLPPCVTALVCRIPIAHIAGGETSQGAIDEAIRHGVTKMACLHFTSTEAYRRRVVQLGERPERVFAVGDLGVDSFGEIELLSRDELGRDLGFDLGERCAVFTYHPVTLEADAGLGELEAVLQAIAGSGIRVVFTKANADAAGRLINGRLAEFCARHGGRCLLVGNLGQKRYVSLLRAVDVMIGNSSSGIIEAASFKLPVVNVGDRQKGRVAPANVINAGGGVAALKRALAKALSAGFRASLADLKNPYAPARPGAAAGKILGVLKSARLGEGVLKKEFFDLDFPLPAGGRGHGRTKGRRRRRVDGA